MSNNKPVLVLPYIEFTNSSAFETTDCLCGPISELLSSFNINGFNVSELFKVVFLSPYHGLIDVDNYKGAITKPWSVLEDVFTDRNSIRAYLRTPGVSELFVSQMASIVDGAPSVTVVLDSKHGEVFYQLYQDKKFSNLLSNCEFQFPTTNNASLSDVLMQLRHVLETAKESFDRYTSNKPVFKGCQPIMFRSGISGAKDLKPIIESGANFGTSMALVLQKDTDRVGQGNSKQAIRNAIASETRKHPVFLDNGLITYATRSKSGVEIPTATKMLNDYRTVLDGLSAQQKKNLYCVIPDDPFIQSSAVENVRNNLELISGLASEVDLMLPIHHCHIESNKSYIEHAIELFDLLDWNENIRVAIPMKAKIEGGLGAVKPELPLELLDQLLSLTSPKTGKPFVRKVHFLALSECHPRFNAVIDMCVSHGVTNVSADTCRLTGIFGKFYGNSRGAREMRHFRKSEAFAAATQSDRFKEYTFESEYEEGAILDFCVSCLHDDKKRVDFVCGWNKHFGYMELPTAPITDEEQLFKLITCFENYYAELPTGSFDELKWLAWEAFTPIELDNCVLECAYDLPSTKDCINKQRTKKRLDAEYDRLCVERGVRDHIQLREAYKDDTRMNRELIAKIESSELYLAVYGDLSGQFRACRQCVSSVRVNTRRRLRDLSIKSLIGLSPLIKSTSVFTGKPFDTKQLKVPSIF